MRAMILHGPGEPLRLEDIPAPVPAPDELLIRVGACGVCRTDLHVVDGDLAEPVLPLVPGHQIVGRVEGVGRDVTGFAPGERVGVPWLGGSCGGCRFCAADRENLCDHAVYTGYQRQGGFAELCTADARFAFPLLADYPDIQAAPLLCAGLIGWRAYRMCGEARRIGLYGFGAAAHIIAQVAIWQDREVYAFTRPDDEKSRAFARSLGVAWAGPSDAPAPHPLDAAIIFAPVGALVPVALRAVDKGGTVVCAGIHMSDIPAFPYADLWMERTLKSVANLTRRDGEEFLALAPRVPVRTEVTVYSLEEANAALDDLRHGRFEGAAVITLV